MTEQFARVPLSVLSRCSGAELRVWVAIAAHAGADGTAYPSQTRLASILGISPQAVRLHLGSLKRAGLIETRKIPTGLFYTLPDLKPQTQPAEILVPSASPACACSGTHPQAQLTPIRKLDYHPSASPANTHPQAQLALEQTIEQTKEQTREQEEELHVCEVRTKSATKSADVEALFAIWQQVTGKTRARLDDRRRKFLRNGIKMLGVADAESAVRGLALSDFHMGNNEHRKPYNEPFHCFRDAEHAERFLALYASSGVPVAIQYDTLVSRWDHHFEESVVAVSSGKVDRLGVQTHKDWDLHFASDAVVACAEAGKRLVKEVGDQGKSLARSRYQNALEEYQDLKRKRSDDESGTDGSGDQAGNGCARDSENSQGIFR